MNEITFYQCFQENILNGSKTITIRDANEKDFVIGSIIDVFTYEKHQWFARIKILSVTPLAFHDLNEIHAKQENMTLPQLQKVIRNIYPNGNQLFVIHYQLVDSAKENVAANKLQI